MVDLNRIFVISAHKERKALTDALLRCDDGEIQERAKLKLTGLDM